MRSHRNENSYEHYFLYECLHFFSKEKEHLFGIDLNPRSCHFYPTKNNIRGSKETSEEQKESKEKIEIIIKR